MKIELEAQLEADKKIRVECANQINLEKQRS